MKDREICEALIAFQKQTEVPWFKGIKLLNEFQAHFSAAKVKRMIEALEFYAKEENWHNTADSQVIGGSSSATDYDYGKKARAALDDE